MGTKKSLIVSMALVLALICTGIIAASAHTTPPAKKKAPTHSAQGVNFDPLGILNLTQQLNNQVDVMGVPLGQLVPAALERLHSANMNSLNPLGSLLAPGQPQLKRFITPTPIKHRP